MSEKKRVTVKEGLFYEAKSANEESYLIGSKCYNCGHVAFPKEEICHSCLKENTMQQVRLSRKGKIETFALVQQAPLGFTAPYIMSYIYLPEGVKLYSLIAGKQSEEEVKIGQEVELVIDKIREDENGNEIIGWKFKPI